MDEGWLARTRSRLVDFASELFEEFARADQVATGLTYLRGLLLDGQRKSMQPMAARLRVDHQRLQQFITSSTWDFVAVRRRIAARVIAVVQPRVWVIDDTGFPKEGDASPGVARQYSGTLGKVDTCQIAVSLHAATDTASGVLGWRLFIPQSWDQTCLPGPDGQPPANPHADRRGPSRTKGQAGELLPAGRRGKNRTSAPVPVEDQAAAIVARRARSRIPDTEVYRPKWVMALELIDENIAAGHVPPVLVSDAGYGQVGEFRNGLTSRDIRYVLATNTTTTAHPAHAQPANKPAGSTGRPARAPAYPDKAVSVKTLALQTGRDQTVAVTWRQGSRRTPANPDAAMSGHFLALRIRPAGKSVDRDQDGTFPQRWLLVEWPPGKAEPSDYWLSDLPEDTPITELVHLAKMRWRIEHDYRETKTALGLDHFEGRSWTGWHRHVTLVTAAQLFITELRLDENAHPATLTGTHPKAPGQN